MLLPGEQKMRDGVINCEDDWSCLNLKAKAMDAILPAVYRRDLPTPASRTTLSPLSNCPIQNASGEDNQKNKANAQLWVADTGLWEGIHTGV